MNKKKIISSLALAGVLSASVLGINAATDGYLKPVGIYKKLVNDAVVVPYVLSNEDITDIKTLKVSDLVAEFKNVELVNGESVTDTAKALRTGDTFRANGMEYTIVVYGDVNKDTEMDSVDTLSMKTIILQDALGKVTADKFQMEAADVVNDGEIDVFDTLALQNYILGRTDELVNPLPPEEDETAPVITIDGYEDKDTVYVNANNKESFEVPSATAFDDYDGKVEVVVDATEVKVNEDGTYTVTYTATDKSGNEATATLTVVVDTVKPELENVPEESPVYVNKDDAAEYELPEVTNSETGEVVTPKVQLKQPDGTFKDAEFNTSEDGEYQVTWTTKDAAGNETTSKVVTVIVDTKAPDLQGVPEESPVYVNEKNAAEYELPEVTNSETEEVVTPKVQLKQPDGAFKDAEFNTSEDGEYQVTWTTKDAAGNETTSEVVTVIVDTKAPNLNGLEDVEPKKYINKGDGSYTLPTVTTDEEDLEVEITVSGPKETFDPSTVGEYTITYSVTDKAGNNTTKTITVVVSDEGPTLSIEDQTIYVKQNAEYTLPEVTATDLVDGNLTDSIEKVVKYTDDVKAEATTPYEEETIKTDNEGKYVVTYTVRDSMENEATATLTIIVDGTNPTIQVKYNTQNPTNQNVTVTLVSDEPLQELDGWTLSDDGCSMTKDYENNTEVPETVKVKDLAGNESEEKTIEIHNIDKEIHVVVEYNPKQNTPTKNSVLVTVKTDPEEEIDANSVPDGWTLSVSDHKSIYRRYTHNIITSVVVKDTLGNSTTASINVGNIDIDPPTAEVEFDITEKTNSDVVVTLIANEALTGAVTVDVTEDNPYVDPESITWSLVEGKDDKEVTATVHQNGRYKVTITDLAGNTADIYVVVTNIDKKSPTLTVTQDPDHVTNTDIIVTVTSDEELDSETIPDGWTLQANKMTMTKTFEQNGSDTVTVKDLAGNEATTNIEVANIDKDAPVVTGVENGMSYQSRSGSYKNATFAETTATLQHDDEGAKTYTSGSDITAEGHYVLIVTDEAGNVTTVEFDIDNTAPTVTELSQVILKKNDVYTENLEVTDNIDEVAELTIETEYKYKGLVNVEDQDETVTEIDTTGTKDGVYEVTYTVKDRAGNTASKTQRVVVDGTPATVVKKEYSTPESAQSVIATVTFSEDMKSNVDSLPEGWTKLGDDAKVYTKTYTTNATETLTFYDLAGNPTEVEIAISNVDSDLPTYNIEKNPDVPTNTEVIVKIKVGEEIQDLVENTDWSLAKEGEFWVLTKTYQNNTTQAEKVILKDLAGNTVEVEVEVTNIDKDIPTGNVVYNPEISTKTTGNVDVTIELSEEVKDNVDGWTLSQRLSDNRWILTKTYENNTEGQVTVNFEDLAGNPGSSTVEVTNIDREGPEVTNVVNGGSYQNVKPNFSEGTATLQKEGEDAKDYTSDTLVGPEDAQKGTDTSKDGSYRLVVTDALGNETVILFTIDNVAPVVKVNGDVQEEVGKRYTEATPTWNEGTAMLYKFTDIDEADTVSGNTDSETIWEAEKEITAKGKYKLVVTDKAGNKTEVVFVVDNSGPQFTKPVEGKTYNKTEVDGGEVVPEVTVSGTIAKVELTKNGKVVETYTSSEPFGKIEEDGEYILTVTDDLGVSNSVNFSIDTTGPEVRNVEDGGSYKTATPEFTEGTATLNKDSSSDDPFTSGTEVAQDGSYVLKVTDEYGNVTEINFTIDNVAPNVTGVTNNAIYSSNGTTGGSLEKTTLQPESDDGDIAKVVLVKDGDTVKDGENMEVLTDYDYPDGEYKLTVTDKAGNETVFEFTVDTTVKNAVVQYSNGGKPTNEDVRVTITTDEELDSAPSDWTLVGNTSITRSFTENSGSEQTVTITDKYGNTLDVKYEVKGIDRVAPKLEEEVSYNTKSPTKEPVIVTIKVDEEVKVVGAEGWNISEGIESDAGKWLITKTFNDNAEDVLTITDLAGNALTDPDGHETEKFADGKLTVTVDNIYATGPVLEILGLEEKETVVKVLSGRIDPEQVKNVKATDCKGKDISSSVQITVEAKLPNSQVDIVDVDELSVATPVTYTITYTVVDDAGNETTDTRTIIVSAE